MAYLGERGIPAKYTLPIINQPVYRELFGELEPHYPNAARVNRDSLLLGCHVGLSLEDVDRQSEAIHDFFDTH
jgi:perosamine synthetase